jgi:group II intron reverse transcriptase/maturase
MLDAIHRQGYRATDIRRVYIPKPGKTEKRPLGVPTVSDRALQRTAAEVLSAIYEQDFLPCSFGGRPRLSAHHALATLNEVIAGGMTGWVLEADLKNFFGSLDHEWVLRFVEHRVGDPRLISLIRRWLKAGVLEDGAVHPSDEETPQGGSISVLLSNLYLHYVLDLWFERVVKCRLRGDAHLVRYIDDFVICFQYRSDALRVQDALRRRLGKFGLTLESTKTKLVEFGRFAQRHAGKRGRNRPETIYFLGLTLYCTRNRKGNFKVGMRTEKARLRRSLMSLQELMRQVQHHRISDQVGEINAALRGCVAAVGQVTLPGTPSTRSNSGRRCCDPNCASHTGSCRHSRCCEPTTEERGARNPHATFCGNRGRATASGDPVGEEQSSSLPRPKLLRGIACCV